jgi:hypothetical protein
MVVEWLTERREEGGREGGRERRERTEGRIGNIYCGINIPTVLYSKLQAQLSLRNWNVPTAACQCRAAGIEWLSNAQRSGRKHQWKRA